MKYFMFHEKIKENLLALIIQIFERYWTIMNLLNIGTAKSDAKITGDT